jgi:hypothetical protein
MRHGEVVNRPTHRGHAGRERPGGGGPARVKNALNSGSRRWPTLPSRARCGSQKCSNTGHEPRRPRGRENEDGPGSLRRDRPPTLNAPDADRVAPTNTFRKGRADPRPPSEVPHLPPSRPVITSIPALRRALREEGREVRRAHSRPSLGRLLTMEARTVRRNHEERPPGRPPSPGRSSREVSDTRASHPSWSLG